jgi:hypothetical protein
MNVATKAKTLPWQETYFVSLDKACGILKCGFPDLDDLIKAGRLRVSALPGHRQHGRFRRVFTKDVATLIHVQEQARAAPAIEPNYTLGDHPGCGACSHLCDICKRIQNRCTSSLINDDEACEILGFYPKGGLITFLRKNNVYIDPKRKSLRISFADVAELKQRLVLQNIDIDQTRHEIVDALAQMIELRRQEMAEVDTELIRYSVGHEQPLFRYGRVVDLNEPPVGLWYVYHLCYPSGRPFYVGKGIGDRMYQHVKETMKGKETNTYKCAVIRKLLKKGEQICYRVVFVTPEESEAYEYEIQEIARIGYKRLTNLTVGGVTVEERDRALGSSVPNEQRNYKQFMHLLSLHPSLSSEERTRALRFWAEDRICQLRKLRGDTEGLSHDEAVRKLDAEIDALSGLTAQQRSFVDLEERRYRHYSEWSFDY